MSDDKTCFKQTELGKIPTNWEVVTMRDISSVRQGLQIPLSHDLENPDWEDTFTLQSNI
jgi:hypothetical protein